MTDTSTKRKQPPVANGGRLPITAENPFGLTEMCRLFVIEYGKDFNLMRAAIAAGYSPGSAMSQSYKLLQRPEVQAAIGKSLEDRRARVQEKFSGAQLKADRVLLEIARISFADLRLLYDEDGIIKPIQEWPDDIAHAVSKIETEEILEYDPITKEKVFVGYRRKITLNDKNSALEKLMKHLGQYEQDNLQKQMKMNGETPHLVAARTILQGILDRSKLVEFDKENS
jgi:phage terminase small subunit